MGKKYYYTHRNKFMAIDATSFDEFLDMIEANLCMLKEWKNSDLVEFTGEGVGDDYATFSTSDKEYAKKYGFIDEDEFYGLDEDEEFLDEN